MSKSFVDLIDEWEDKMHGPSDHRVKPTVYAGEDVKPEVMAQIEANEAKLMAPFLRTAPLTHAERRSYREMKRWVAGRCSVGLVVQVPPYTCVEVRYAWEPGSYIVRHGFSKSAPGDEWDCGRGCDIAKGRAVAAIARALMVQGPIADLYEAKAYGEHMEACEDSVLTRAKLDAAFGPKPVSGEQSDYVDNANGQAAGE
jgi:hypothetical protein